jgi:hypothetical protein
MLFLFFSPKSLNVCGTIDCLYSYIKKIEEMGHWAKFWKEDITLIIFPYAGKIIYEKLRVGLSINQRILKSSNYHHFIFLI